MVPTERNTAALPWLGGTTAGGGTGINIGGVGGVVGGSDVIGITGGMGGTGSMGKSGGVGVGVGVVGCAEFAVGVGVLSPPPQAARVASAKAPKLSCKRVRI